MFVRDLSYYYFVIILLITHSQLLFRENIPQLSLETWFIMYTFIF